MILMKKKIAVFIILLGLLISNLNANLKTNKYYSDEQNPVNIRQVIGKINC
jgi:hypothetical protein